MNISHCACYLRSTAKCLPVLSFATLITGVLPSKDDSRLPIIIDDLGNVTKLPCRRVLLARTLATV